MENSFWHEKWKKNQLGFHLDDVHPLLKKYFNKIFSTTDPIFVPLCGKTLDMRYLLSQNRSIVGCELSEIAVKDFYTPENEKKTLQLDKNDKFSIYSSAENNLTSKIIVGDYFDLATSDLNSCTGIYDRASLIALPKDVRIKYVELLKHLVPKAKMLLITLDYDQNIMTGPPFSVNKNEVESLFSFANIELLKRSNIIEEEPQFKSKGLTEFNQSAYYIEWDLTR
ncbi:MAG: thiopurine S-methyltransferase [Kangiella sp.]|nr:MAG: thiopurine S-methyltransferase [Kangiella sp.]